MKFSTEVEIKPSQEKIDYNSPVMFTGSCFAEEIGRQLSYGKMKVLTNPFGVLYNPLSTSHSLELIIEGKYFTKEDLYRYEDRYLSFSHDTSFSSRDINESLNKINHSVMNARNFLSDASFLFVTFGTAWIYRWKVDNRVVANCHKIPSLRFTRQLLKQADITARWLEIVERLKGFNNELTIVFTISPVRHLKDGAHGNQLSKSILMTSINELISSNGQLSYFPSYEIMMDELRDYRFYKKDMVHPSEAALEYIWKRFRECYFTGDSDKLYDRVVKITEATRHILNGSDSQDNSRFSKSMLNKIDKLLSDYPNIDLNREKTYFKNLLEK